MPSEKLPHIILRNQKNTSSFSSPLGRNTPYTSIRDKPSHGAILEQSFINSINELDSFYENITVDPAVIDRGAVVEMTFSPNAQIDVATLENKTSKIELLNVKTDNNQSPVNAVIYIPEGKDSIIAKQITAYSDPDKGTKAQTYDQTEGFAVATLDKLWLENRALPTDIHQLYRWEVWLKTGTIERVREVIALLPQTSISAHNIKFPEREICSITASYNDLIQLHFITKCMSGFRYLPTLSGFFDALPPSEQIEWTDELNARITYDPNTDVSVCVLDTGIRTHHPLLSYNLINNGVDSYSPDWGVEDDHGHGTQMAGIALFGDLTPLLEDTAQITLNHGVESVKVFPPTGSNDIDHIGFITAQAVAIAEINNVDIRRVFCLSWSMEHAPNADGSPVMEGKPTPLSAKIDQLAFGVIDFDNWQIDDDSKRLFIISAGNIRDSYPPAQYGYINALSEIEDPAQAWNALTVGAYTDKVFTNDPNYHGWSPLTGQGGLSARSRTSILWGASHWPTKPDIVLEGGNYFADPSNSYFNDNDDTSILTTGKTSTFSVSRDTSPANAEASRLAAKVMKQYPEFWPETIRGLLVHSAEWTGAMNVELTNKEQKIEHLRRYGYGIPQTDFLFNSFSNRPCAIIQDYLDPFDESTKVKDSPVFGDLNHYNLPWPEEALKEIYDKEVKLRVTLSYFIEPSPSERPPQTKYNYTSHGLKFELKLPNDTEAEFLSRVGSQIDIDDDLGNFGSANDDPIKWRLGPRSRNRGSVISDVWEGTGSELASQNMIAIIPQGGWWKFRNRFPDNEKPRYKSRIRYSLILSLITEEDVDLYTPINIETATEIET